MQRRSNVPARRWILRIARAIGLGWIGGLVALVAPPAGAATYCSNTADDLFIACGHEQLDDWGVASAACLNLLDASERAACQAEADAALAEGDELCDEQLDGRLEACALLGEARYDPEFDSSLFDTNPTNPTTPNALFPLAVGNLWQYEGTGETNTVEVLAATKAIDGVRCAVVRDLVYVGAELREATDDWYASAKDGAVWYCGEEVKDLESFAGDSPVEPELVSIDGSFKAGRDGDKPGIIALASPQPGDVYLEEFSLGNAEDVTEILSTDYDYGDDAELDEMVPEALVDALCSDDCIVTKNYSLLEPGIFARKYLAPGIGVFLEVEPDEGFVSQLVDCNFDLRCASLPPAAPSPARPTRTEPTASSVAAPLPAASPAPLAPDAFCSDTAQTLFDACGHQILDDFWVASAICTNITSGPDRAECGKDADDELAEGEALCEEQRDARLAACGGLGEGRYDPPFDPADFDDDFSNLTNPNPYYPLAVGNFWQYESATESNTVEVLAATKQIEGVTCIVVHDLVLIDGVPLEDTDDWLAQAKDGAVWYCGEEVKDYETFDGDQPVVAELVSNDGSFKAGRDHARPGVLMPAAPAVGTLYREEFALGSAEDLSEIVATDYSYGEDEELDELVPRALAEALCDGDCVVTRAVSPLEPDAWARKYWAPGIGYFLETEPPESVNLQLVGCNVDPRCAGLPGFELFADGFEAGDFEAWSSQAP